jgi:hypothetical protein
LLRCCICCLLGPCPCLLHSLLLLRSSCGCCLRGCGGVCGRCCRLGC